MNYAPPSLKDRDRGIIASRLTFFRRECGVSCLEAKNPSCLQGFSRLRVRNRCLRPKPEAVRYCIFTGLETLQVQLFRVVKDPKGLAVQGSRDPKGLLFRVVKAPKDQLFRVVEARVGFDRLDNRSIDYRANWSIID